MNNRITPWITEMARDLLALGSIPFYFIVIIRAIIGRFDPFIAQLVIGLVVISCIAVILKICKQQSNTYLARAFVLATFTSLFYQEPLFTTFAFILWVLMIPAAYINSRKTMYGKKNHWKRWLEIGMGILLGIVSAAISYTISPIIIS